MKIRTKIAAALSLILVFAGGTGNVRGEWVPSDNLANPLQPVIVFNAAEANQDSEKLLDEEREAIEKASEDLMVSISNSSQGSMSVTEEASTAYERVANFSSETIAPSNKGESKPSASYLPLKRFSKTANDWNEASTHSSEKDTPSTTLSDKDARDGGSPSTSPSLVPILDNPDILNFLLEENDNPLAPSEKSNHTLSDKAGMAGALADEYSQGTMSQEGARGVDVVDTVRFTEKIRLIYELMNPPEGLHPWLKWLLYSSRVNKEMLSLYYSTLKKRDQIYQRALQSRGKLAILYKNKIFKDMPIFVMPEWGNGDYSLVKIGSDYRDALAGMKAQVNLSSS